MALIPDWLQREDDSLWFMTVDDADNVERLFAKEED